MIQINYIAPNGETYGMCIETQEGIYGPEDEDGFCPEIDTKDIPFDEKHIEEYYVPSFKRILEKFKEAAK